MPVDVHEFLALADKAGFSLGSDHEHSPFNALFEMHPEGGGPFSGRDNALTVLIGFLRAKAWPFEAARDYAAHWNEKYCQPPFDDTEVEQKVANKWATWQAGDWSDLTPEDFEKMAPPPSKWEMLTIDELLARKDEFGELTWIIEGGFALKRLHILSAPPKAAKTFVAMSLAKALASGEDWLDRFPVPQGGVLWIDEEMGPQLMVIRLEKMGFAGGIPFFYLGQQGVKIDNPEHVERIIAAVKEHSIHMVVFDSLRRMHGKKENDNTEMGRLFGPLKAIADAGAAVLVIHHDKKGNVDGGSAGDAAAGAGDLIAQMDMAFGLQRKSAGVFQLTCRAPRLVAEEAALTIDFALEDSPDGKSTFLRELDGEEKAMIRYSRVDRRLEEALHANGDMKATDLYKAAGVDRNTGADAVKRLLSAGAIHEVSGPDSRYKVLRLGQEEVED